MPASIRTKLSIEAREGSVTLTTRDEEGSLVAQIRLSPEQAIAKAAELLNAGFAAKKGEGSR